MDKSDDGVPSNVIDFKEGKRKVDTAWQRRTITEPKSITNPLLTAADTESWPDLFDPPMTAQPVPEITYDTDDHQFARGWEVGVLWARLGNNPNEISGLFHSTNTIMINRIARAKGYSMHHEYVGNNPLWVKVVLTRVTPWAG